MNNTNLPENVTRLKVQPEVIPASRHGISPSSISNNAMKVMNRLNNAGYKSYLVGGCVRDLLLGIEPKDFDVVTDARPEQVRELIRNCRIIGRRFRLAHVHYDREIIEVSTFRASHKGPPEHAHSSEGRIIRDNVYGDIDEDVWRRDFTVNALFLEIINMEILDYVGALEDIEKRILRVIGNPNTRYREDPVRMLRAIRFAAKLDFKIHEQTAKQIHELNFLLEEISTARLFEEFVKLFMGGEALKTYHQLCQHGLFGYLFPQTDEILREEKFGQTDALLKSAFKNTDLRLVEQKPVTPAFLLAAILWTPVINQLDRYKQKSLSDTEAMELASDAVFSRQVATLAIPRRFTRMTREIWTLQNRFNQMQGSKPYRLLSHPRFRAAYDFLLLREQAGEDVGNLTDWWTGFQAENFERYKYKSNRTSSHRGRRFQRDRSNRRR